MGVKEHGYGCEGIGHSGRIVQPNSTFVQPNFEYLICGDDLFFCLV